MDRAISMIRALRPTFMKSTPGRMTGTSASMYFYNPDYNLCRASFCFATDKHNLFAWLGMSCLGIS